MDGNQYDTEGLIISVFGRYAVATGTKMDGDVLIKADSLSLKLRTGYVSPSIRENADSCRESRNENFNTESPPNLAKILSIGDRIKFDAMKIQNSEKNSPKWVAFQGSVRIIKAVTDKKIIVGSGSIVEVHSGNGVFSFQNKKISFDLSAVFPEKVDDMKSTFKVGDEVSFVALDQSKGCRAISVERCSPASGRSQAAESRKAHSPGSQSRHIESVVGYVNGRHRSTASENSDSDRRRSPRRRDLPWDAELTSRSLPRRLDGYGHVTYHGPKCSLLEHFGSKELVFFFNCDIRCESRNRSRTLTKGQVVYFESQSSQARANLNAWWDAKMVLVLDPQEERRQLQKLGYGTPPRHSDGHSTSTSSIMTTSSSSGIGSSSSSGGNRRVQSSVVVVSRESRSGSPKSRKRSTDNNDDGEDRSKKTRLGDKKNGGVFDRASTKNDQTGKEFEKLMEAEEVNAQQYEFDENMDS